MCKWKVLSCRDNHSYRLCPGVFLRHPQHPGDMRQRKVLPRGVHHQRRLCSRALLYHPQHPGDMHQRKNLPRRDRHPRRLYRRVYLRDSQHPGGLYQRTVLSCGDCHRFNMCSGILLLHSRYPTGLCPWRILCRWNYRGHSLSCWVLLPDPERERDMPRRQLLPARRHHPESMPDLWSPPVPEHLMPPWQLVRHLHLRLLPGVLPQRHEHGPRPSGLHRVPRGDLRHGLRGHRLPVSAVRRGHLQHGAGDQRDGSMHAVQDRDIQHRAGAAREPDVVDCIYVYYTCQTGENAHICGGVSRGLSGRFSMHCTSVRKPHAIHSNPLSPVWTHTPRATTPAP